MRAACRQFHQPPAYRTIPAAGLFLTRNYGMVCLQASKQEIHGCENRLHARIQVRNRNCQQWQRVAGRFALFEITLATT